MTLPDIRDIIEAKKLGPAALNEASLGRVYQHVKGKDGAFAIITSWRGNLSPSENKANFRALKGAIRSANLGFFKMKGRWKEEGADEATAEPSLFVPGIPLKLAHKLGNKYDQDAIIYAGPETKGKVALIFKNKSKQVIGKFHPQAIAQAYSTVKGNTFTFECFEYIPQNHIETLIASKP
jgi:hypothetical protein